MNRRSFIERSLKIGALTASLGVPAIVAAKPTNTKPVAEFNPPSLIMTKGERKINWYRPQSQEELSLTYLKNGVWVPGAYEKMCWLLRDIHVNEATKMDTTLIAILDWTQAFLRQYGHHQQIHILSGYRTKKTNDKLENAAKRSQHLTGKAVDIRIPDVPVDYLGKLYKWLAQGGVGIYPNSNFVHIDTGDVRTWRGN